MNKFLYSVLFIVSSLASAADPGVTDKEIVIGAHTAESGIFAFVGIMPKLQTAYFEELNEKGGVNGRKIKFIRMDTVGDVAKAVQFTKKLVEEDNVFAMFASQGPPHQAVYKYLNEKGVPDMFFFDGLVEYAEPPKKWIFPASILWLDEGRAFGNVAVKKFQGKKACFLIGDNALGEEFLKGGTEAIEAGNKKLSDKQKIQIVGVQKVDRKAAQVNAEVLKLKKDGCEVVMTSLYGRPCPTAINYAVSQGWNPTWMVTTWNVTQDFLGLIPESSRNGIISETMVAINEDLGKKTTGWADYKKIAAKVNAPDSQIAVLAYASAELLVETLKRAGKDLTRDKLVSAAENFKNWKCSVCLSAVNTSPKNKVAFPTPTMIVSKNGKWTEL